jgi:biotin carboxylase
LLIIDQQKEIYLIFLSNIELIERTLTLDRQNPRVHFLAAKGHCSQKQKAQVFHHITKAIAMAQYEKMDTAKYIALQKRIKYLL